MVLLKTLLLPALTLFGAAAASNVVDLTPQNFDAEVFGGVPSLVEFYAPWCGHCKRLAPTYEELADSFVSTKKVNIAKVDGDAHKDLSSKYGISGFPTIKYFDGKSKDPIDYNGGRDLDSLQAYIQEQSGARPKKAKIPSEVVMLTDSDFKKTVGQDKHVFVAFTAPWCGHCKTLAPIWESVASVFAADDDVIIAKVDAEANKAIANEFSISSYPTIKFFPKGDSKGIDYTDVRDEPNLILYVNEKAGTHRGMGGLLDETAGTIEKLDSIVAKLTGSNLAEISKEVQKVAKSLTDKYTEYYVKVLTKLAENQKYVEKELNRLQRMVKKGGIARSKEDDIVSRINILKKFVGNAADKVEDSKDEL